MAEVTSAYSPLHIDCAVGQPYGNISSSYTCGFHTGADIPQSSVAVQNPDLYSVSNDGVVTYVYKTSTGTSPALGNQVQILDNRTGLYYRYCHMLYGSINLNVGDKVDINTVIGKMGNTGNSTGTHLHLEATTKQAWACENFVDPLAPLGIPNIRGTVIKYGGEPGPGPGPEPTAVKKSKFSWVLYANKIRKRNNF